MFRAGVAAALRGGREAAWTVCERATALAMLVLGAPLIALIALFIRLSAGAPVLYRGARLGRGRQSFEILKLRTLRVGAQSITGSDLLGSRPELMIRGGRFLRETRLDELPQLWNILRGDMSFVGPRPERPEVFAAKCLGIPGYERRFAVRPGLIGISQLFTPHGTPKRYRTLIDNGVLRKRSSGLVRVGIVAFTLWVVLREVLRRSARHVVQLRAGLFGPYREKRRLQRVAPQGAVVHLGVSGSEHLGTTRLIDISPARLVVECESSERERGTRLERATEFELEIPVLGRHRPALRSARCTGRVLARRPGPGGTRLVVEYEPCSPRSEYVIHQYFLRASLALAPRCFEGRPPAGAIPVRPAWSGPVLAPPAPATVAVAPALPRSPVAFEGSPSSQPVEQLTS